MGILAKLITWESVSLFGILFIVGTIFLRRKMNYWIRRGIPHVPPEPLFGNFREAAFLRATQGEILLNLYKKLGNEPFMGIYQFISPALLVKDPELIRQIMIKEFWSFRDRGIVINPERDPLSQHLLFLRGNKWKVLRGKISPTFTSGKMKMMYNLIDECAQQLTQHMESVATNEQEIEVKEKMATYTTDVIGTCAFGLQCNAMNNSNSQFRVMGRKANDTSLLSALRRNVLLLSPKIAEFFHLSVFPKDLNAFFINLVKETIEYREKNNIKRNDFMHLLMELKNKGQVEEDTKEIHYEYPLHEQNEEEIRSHYGFEITDEILASQAFVFFIAGFETSSSTISFALYELAVNPDVQTRLRREIDDVLEKYDGKFTYEIILGMKYLDQVVSETLRLYPPIPLLVRESTNDTFIPGTKLALEKGTRVIVPIWALHRDPKYFSNADVFDPDHFSDASKAKRPHYTYLPFGEGPRQCIGMRFGLLQTKLGLAYLLSKYQFMLGKDTPVPLKFNPRSLITACKGGIKLKITKRY